MKAKRKTGLSIHWWYPTREFEMDVHSDKQSVIDTIKALHNPKANGRKRKVVSIKNTHDGGQEFTIHSGKIFIEARIQSQEEAVRLSGKSSIHEAHNSLLFIGLSLPLLIFFPTFDFATIVIALLVIILPIVFYHVQLDHRDSLLEEFYQAMDADEE